MECSYQIWKKSINIQNGIGGFENMLSDMRKGKRKPANMFDSIRETIRQFEEEEKNK